MSKRELVPILRQSLLICRNPLKRFLFLQSNPQVFSLPIFTAQQGETFRQSITRGASQISIQLNLKGILRVQLGNNNKNNFYRCICYATTDSVDQSPKIAFRSYEQISQINLNQYENELLKEMQSTRTIYSINFFRQNHVEKAPINPRRNIMVQI